MMNSHESSLLSKLLQKHGLGSCADSIVAGSCSRFDLIAGVREDYEAIGNSRFGGQPDLPMDCLWLDKLEDYYFVFQVGFADFPKNSTLPNAGHLLVFADEDAQDALSFFLPPGPELVRHSRPVAKDNALAEIMALKLTVSGAVDIPARGSSAYIRARELGLVENYEELLAVCSWPKRKVAHLLGLHPSVRGDFARKAAAEYAGGKAEDWKVLWTIASNFSVSGVEISDCMALLGLIQREALTRMDLSNLWPAVDVY